MDIPKPDMDNPAAPFGYNDDGSPLTPYGMKADGKTPRISNRGRRTDGTPRATPSKAPAAASRKRMADDERKQALLQLSEMFVEAPLATASTSKMLTKRLGEKQTDALAADALIWSHYAPSLADGLIVYSQSKPAVLGWLDGVQEKAPILLLLQVGIQMTRAIVSNHMDPNPDVAKTGRRMVRLNAAKMAEAINEEAARAGIPSDDEIAAMMRAQEAAQNAAA